jgi:hypothetical protein
VGGDGVNNQVAEKVIPSPKSEAPERLKTLAILSIWGVEYQDGHIDCDRFMSVFSNTTGILRLVKLVSNYL